MEEYLDRFERCYGRVKAGCKTAKIPEKILAFMVLERADVDETRRMLILSKMNLEKKSEMFKDMCKELKLVLGGGPGTSKVEGKEKDADSVIRNSTIKETA